MKQLKIVGVNDLTVGRHGGRTINGMDAPFVVVYGPNESGKSTLAEFLVWTIGGPWRTFAQNTEAFRRSPDGVVFGRFLGALDGEVIDLDSRFELRRAGTPRDQRKGVIGIHDVDPTKLAERLGSLTAADYKTIYRLYGADLGDIGSADAFSDLFSRFALGTATGGISPRQSLDVLRRNLASAKRSTSGLRTGLRDINRQITEASNAPDQIMKLENEERSLSDEVKKTGDLEGELAARKSLLSQVRGGFTELETLQREQAALDVLPEISEAWENAADNHDNIKAVAEQIATAAKSATAAEESAVAAVATCGLDKSVLAGKTLTGPERLALTTAASAVVTARREVEASRRELATASGHLEDAVEAVDERSRVLGIDRENLSNLDAIGASLDSIDARVQRWIEDSNKANEARADVASERTRQENVGAPASPAARRPLLSPRYVAAGIVVVCVVAAVNRTAAIVGGLILASILFFGHKGNNNVRPVVDTGRLAELEGRARGANEAASGHRAFISSALGDLDFLITDPDTSRARITELKHLVVLRAQVLDAKTKVATAKVRAEAAPTELQSAEVAASALLAPRGIPMAVVNEAFDAWMIEYETALGAVEKARFAHEKVGQLRAEFGELIAGVQSELMGLSPEAVVMRVSEMRTQVQKRREVLSSVRDAELKVSGANMDSVEVREVLAQYPTEAALAVQVDLLDDEINSLRERRDDLISRRADVVRELEDLRATEVLAELALTRGQIEEDLAETESKVNALELAMRVLDEVIDTYERDNQDPVVATASDLISRVAPDWGSVIMSRNERGEPEIERHSSDGRLGEHVISDGGRALLYLGLRLAFATKDAERRHVALPIICDDPLVHFDDNRQLAAIQLLADISDRHQVVLFTCEERTRDHAAALGARVVQI